MEQSIDTPVGPDRVLNLKDYQIDLLCCACKHIIDIKGSGICTECGEQFCRACVNHNRENNKCHSCQSEFKSSKLQKTVIEILQKLIIKCIHSSCSQALSYNQLHGHEILCEERRVTCEACNLKVTRKELKQHLLSCNKAKKKCDRCPFEGHKDDFNHCCNTVKFIDSKYHQKDLVANLPGTIEERLKSIEKDVKMYEDNLFEISSVVMNIKELMADPEIRYNIIENKFVEIDDRVNLKLEEMRSEFISSMKDYSAELVKEKVVRQSINEITYMVLVDNKLKCSDDQALRKLMKKVGHEGVDEIEEFAKRFLTPLKWVNLKCDGLTPYGTNNVADLNNVHDRSRKKGIYADNNFDIILTLNREVDFEEIEIGGFIDSDNYDYSNENGNAAIETSKDGIVWKAVGKMPIFVFKGITRIKLIRSKAKHLKLAKNRSTLNIGYLQVLEI